MRGVGAHQPGLAGRGLGQQVAAHIPGRQAQAAQAANHHVGKVLAHAPAQPQRFERGRARVGGVGCVGKVGMDARHQVAGGLHQRSAGCKALGGIGHKVGMPGNVGRGKAELGGRVVGLAAPVAQALAHGLPGLAGRCGGHGQGLQQAFGAHPQLLVGERQAEERAGVAKHVLHHVALGWGGVHLQAVGQHALHHAGAWAQMGHVLGVLHRRAVVVHRFVDDAQLHGQAPTLWRSASMEWVK